MDEQQRHDSGMRKRRKVLGNAWVDKGLANRNAFNTEFQELITRYAFGEIWTRPHFDDRTRRVLVIGTLLALGSWDEFRLQGSRGNRRGVRLAQALAGSASVSVSAGRSSASTITVPSTTSNSLACSRSASPSPASEASSMLTKLIRQPMPSAIDSASSHPPNLRIFGLKARTVKIAKNATTTSRPSASSQAARTVLAAVRCRWSLMKSATATLGRSNRLWIGETMMLKATMVQVGMK